MSSPVPPPPPPPPVSKRSVLSPTQTGVDTSASRSMLSPTSTSPDYGETSGIILTYLQTCWYFLIVVIYI